MKLVLTDSKYLKESIGIISEIVNEAAFKITPNAVELIAMDPANVAMVIFKLLSSAFSEYDVKEEVDIAINLNNLKQILRRAKPEDRLTIEIADSSKLKIQLKSKNTRTFSLPIIDTEEKQQKIPDLKFPVMIQTASSILNDAIEDVGIVAESVTFLTEKNSFTVKAEGELSEAKVDFEENDDMKINSPPEKTRAKYSIEYLKKMISGGKLADKVVIQFNNNYPLRLDYKVIDKVLLSFILAPRVENE